jgi:hypothetical protein
MSATIMARAAVGITAGMWSADQTTLADNQPWAVASIVFFYWPLTTYYSL